MGFEKYVNDGIINLYDLRNDTSNKEICKLIDFIKERKDIKEFGFGDHDTSHNIKSRRGNNMKPRCIGVGIGLVAGLVAGCCLGQETLTLIGVSGVVLIAFAIVGALLGAGAGYVIGKCLDKIKVTNMQEAISC
ncbi:hypothetical protein EJB00_05565 [Wolbachia endosymbiont of Drosophila mauritiana]|uniref:hypothetical protein n=1 Tax=unclassified Wolbachia TaxID=2640676 RepID=UPI00107E6437|nr:MULTISPECIES: hypothetical protein [unclassified Wolbachia]QCB62997.1 hypothetical protein EJA99_05580 [Wolbachia endosymbiont of Drosophila mauritiana]QCB64042.1 hypothetical protein EJB00_05565 [Wolbachia endosymbiont of Drosophila mauritiana]QWE33691.1 Uncharacterized protein WwMa_08070 [Wolbachia endosymbiont of Drosophila simulans]TGB06137.1 hypothetical protein E5C28_04555 [Wolbachia endosymbiont of Drosophila mauritiana]